MEIFKFAAIDFLSCRVVKKLLHSPRDGEDSDGSENKNDRFNAERPVFPQQPENVGGSSEKRSNIRMNDLNFLEV